jgi:hypothetical protein
MNRFAALALLAPPLMLSSGCLPSFVDLFIDPMGYKAALRMTQRQYTNDVRWGDIDRAAQFVDPDVRDQFVAVAGRFRDIRVTDYEIGEIQFGPKQETATVRVTYHAYLVASMIEKEIRETQEWKRTSGAMQGSDWVVKPDIADLLTQLGDTRG